MRKIVIDMCPFMGLSFRYEGEEEIHIKGNGLNFFEEKRLDEYFNKFYGKSFDRDRAIELAQLALDNKPIPKGWKCKV